MTAGLLLHSCCPSRSDKDADTVARIWVDQGKEAAQKKFDAFCTAHRLLDYEAVMFADKVRYRKSVLEKTS